MGRRYEYETPSFRLGYCAMSGEILKIPVVGCQLGRMYNKTSIRRHFMMRISLHNKTDRKFNHIKQLGDVKKLNLTLNPKRKPFLRRAKNYEAQFMCPITKEPLDDDHSFVFLWTCGCVYSKEGLKQISGLCPACKKAFTPKDVVPLSPTKEEEEKMRDKIEQKKHESVPLLEDIVAFKLGCCAMSGEPLKPPIVGCQLGRMYNRNSIRRHFKNIIKFPEMVDKNFSYIKLPSDVKILNLAYNPKYRKRSPKSDPFATQFICPITDKPMDGINNFAFLWSCGCVYSKEGLNLINGLCPYCQKVFTTYDIIPLDPSKDELKELRSRMEAKMPSITTPPPATQNMSREPSIIFITRNRLSTTSTISQISEKFQRHMVGIITIMILTIVLVCIMTVTALL